MKTFTSTPPQLGEPMPFRIEGWREVKLEPPGDGEQQGEQQTPQIEPETHDFAARPDVSGTVVFQLDLVTGSGRGPNGRGFDAVMDFFEAALVEGDWPRFRDLIRDPKFFVRAETLNDVAMWLYGKYTARPTKPPVG